MGRALGWGCLLLSMTALGAVETRAAQPEMEQVVFERDWAAQQVPYFRVAVRGDGSGEVVLGRGEDAKTTPITVGDGTREKLFAVGPAVAAGKCEGGNKHTAKTGEKTLTVVSKGGGEAKCTFNYTEDKRLQEAVTAFSGIETTVEEVSRLEKLARFDRLGLDAELGSFLQLAKDGRALELRNLEPVLRRLENNPDVMERVRSRSAELLAMAQAGK